MKKILLFSVLFFYFSSITFCQVLEKAGVPQLQNVTPQEKVFLHFNSSLLFTGEYLYYKFYSLNSETDKFSAISKIGYVELIGEDGKQVFHHKLELENGIAQGDFFISTSVPSGNYKLLGYTQWMKNGGKNHFFQNDMIIINPYQGDQSALRDPKSEEIKYTAEKNTSEKYLENVIFESEGKAEFLVNLPKGSQYGTREAVILSISALNNEFEAGNYSISVKKIDSVEIPLRFTTRNYNSLYKAAITSKNGKNDLISLPELRGDLISGTLQAENSDKPSLAGMKVALSIPGKEFLFKIAGTDKNGTFYFNLDENYSGEKAFLQILGEQRDNYNIIINENPRIASNSLSFEKFYLHPEMESLILQRSVYNQIENAYFSVKPDTLVNEEINDAFYGDKPIFFDLDEYTRFPSIKETFVEIIKFAGIRNAGDGKQVFEVRGPEGSLNYELPPLLIVDGMLIQDHAHFIPFPAGKVQKIGIIRDNYYYGPQVYSGLIIVETINGGYAESLMENYIKELNLMAPQPKKEYFRQKYDENNTPGTSRIPDFRNQLLWLPSVQISSEEKNIQFFTSDVKGKFEISIEGFSNAGEAFSAKKIFVVK